MADPRTSVAVPPSLKKRFTKMANAHKPPIGWTQKMVLLAEERADELDGRKAPRQPMPAGE